MASCCALRVSVSVSVGCLVVSLARLLQTLRHTFGITCTNSASPAEASVPIWLHGHSPCDTGSLVHIPLSQVLSSSPRKLSALRDACGIACANGGQQMAAIPLCPRRVCVLAPCLACQCIRFPGRTSMVCSSQPWQWGSLVGPGMPPTCVLHRLRLCGMLHGSLA